MNTQYESQNSTIQRIVEGSLKLSTKEEFENLLTRFPESADLHREYADFLSKKKQNDAAYEAYNRAADYYIGDGNALKAIVAKIRAWSILKPDHSQGRTFHAAVQSTSSGDSSLRNFFSAMSYPEFINIMLRMIRVRFPADQFVVKYGDPAKDIYFIVSGTIEERTHLPAKKRGSSPSTSMKFLSDNDIFGEVFPLDQMNASQSDLKTITSVELVKIKKPILLELLKKHKGIENLLQNIRKEPSGNLKDRSWISIRRTVRHEIPIKAHLKISFGDKDNEIELSGFIRDISFDGACIELDDYHGDDQTDLIEDAEALLQIHLSVADERLDIMGTILWCKKDKEATLVGIQFKNLSDKDKFFLNNHCFGGDGEQDLIWNLWATYVKE